MSGIIHEQVGLEAYKVGTHRYLSCTSFARMCQPLCINTNEYIYCVATLTAAVSGGYYSVGNVFPRIKKSQSLTLID